MNGICFIEPLFNKVVTGEKTQTRRIINHFGNKEHYGKLLCHWGLSRPPYLAETGDWRWELQTAVDDSHSFIIKSKYNVGETVYLKEPYSYLSLNNQEPVLIYKYGEDYSDIEEVSPIKWKNKLFMPASAARYFIEITAVRAERLQDISEEDCLKEGIENIGERRVVGYPLGVVFRYSNGYNCFVTAREAYAALIDKINGKGTWERNPWVWVYDFKLIKTII